MGRLITDLQPSLYECTYRDSCQSQLGPPTGLLNSEGEDISMTRLQVILKPLPQNYTSVRSAHPVDNMMLADQIAII